MQRLNALLIKDINTSRKQDRRRRLLNECEKLKEKPRATMRFLLAFSSEIILLWIRYVKTPLTKQLEAQRWPSDSLEADPVPAPNGGRLAVHKCRSGA